MNGSSNVLVLGVTGQVGKLVATNLKNREAKFSVGSRRKANLRELADQFGASRFIDLDDPRTFDEALNNVTSIFLITCYTVDAAKRNRLDSPRNAPRPAEDVTSEGRRTLCRNFRQTNRGRK